MKFMINDSNHRYVNSMVQKCIPCTYDFGMSRCLALIGLNVNNDYHTQTLVGFESSSVVRCLRSSFFIFSCLLEYEDSNSKTPVVEPCPCTKFFLKKATWVLVYIIYKIEEYWNRGSNQQMPCSHDGIWYERL